MRSIFINAISFRISGEFPAGFEPVNRPGWFLIRERHIKRRTLGLERLLLPKAISGCPQTNGDPIQLRDDGLGSHGQPVKAALPGTTFGDPLDDQASKLVRHGHPMPIQQRSQGRNPCSA